MRRKAATALVALLALAATPSAFAKGSVTIDGQLAVALRALSAHAVPAALSRNKDQMRSCQVGASRARVRGATETERKASTVACEQPARANLNLPSGLKSAETGALVEGG